MDSSQRKIARIHDFNLDFDYMSSRLCELQKQYPSGLIIPIMGKDIQSPGIPKMIEEINQCQYLTKVIIDLSEEDHDDYE